MRPDFSHHTCPRDRMLKLQVDVLPQTGSPSSPPLGRLRPVNFLPRLMLSTSLSSNPITTLPSFFGAFTVRLATLSFQICWHFALIKSIPHNNPKRGNVILLLPPHLFLADKGIGELNHSSLPNKKPNSEPTCNSAAHVLFSLDSTLKLLKGRVLTHPIFLHSRTQETLNTYLQSKYNVIIPSTPLPLPTSLYSLDVSKLKKVGKSLMTDFFFLFQIAFFFFFNWRSSHCGSAG